MGWIFSDCWLILESFFFWGFVLFWGVLLLLFWWEIMQSLEGLSLLHAAYMMLLLDGGDGD